MNESAIKRDKHFFTLQNMLGSAIAALGAGTTRIIIQEEGFDEKIQILEYFSDAGKILTDFFHAITLARKSFISPGLPKQIRDVLENVKTDSLLYGEKLSERIKESQSIEKIGQNIRPQENVKKPSIRNIVSLNRNSPPAKVTNQTVQSGPRKYQTRYPHQARTTSFNKTSTYPRRNLSPTRNRSSSSQPYRHRR